MDCRKCNLGINNENYIICSCGNKYRYKWLYKAQIMKINWLNKSQPKYAIQLFRSQYLISKCNTCINTNNDNTPINLPSLNNYYITINICNTFKMDCSTCNLGINNDNYIIYSH